MVLSSSQNNFNVIMSSYVEGIACNRTFHLYLLDAKFQLLGICRSQLYPEEATVFLVHDPIGPILVGLGQ